MNKGIRASIKGVRLTPVRTAEQRQRAWKRVEEAMDALAAEAKRNGLTPRKLRQILRQIEKERKESCLGR